MDHPTADAWSEPRYSNAYPVPRYPVKVSWRVSGRIVENRNEYGFISRQEVDAGEYVSFRLVETEKERGVEVTLRVHHQELKRIIDAIHATRVATLTAEIARLRSQLDAVKAGDSVG